MDRHSEHVIITSFPLRQWLSERASILRYMLIACIVTEQEGERFRRHKLDASERQVLADITSEC